MVVARLVIIVLAVGGLLPLLATPTALDATTVSGTIVMGLGPPIYALIFVDGYRPLTFHLPFWCVEVTLLCCLLPALFTISESCHFILIMRWLDKELWFNF